VSFAAPVFLLGLAAAAVPILIHLIGRRRAPRRRFAALDFVLRSNRRVAQRLRLRQLLLLALRVLLVAAIALMMAKPFSESESDLPALGGGMQSAVLILDDTLSMRRLVDGESQLARAKARAQRLVTHLGAGADIAVLRVTRPSSPLPELTRDTRKVRSAISGLQPSFLHATLASALIQAARILASSSLPERHVFVLSDFASHGWIDHPEKIVEGARLHLVDLAKGIEPENRAVTELQTAPSDAPGQRSMRIAAKVCNFTGRAAQLKLTLSIDERAVARGVLGLAAWSCGSKSFQHSFGRGGVYQAIAAIEPDALREDDERFLVVEVESPIRVLLVNGAPSPIRHRDELFYLETALVQRGGRGQPIVTRTIALGDPAELQVASSDVVVLANVGSLPPGKQAELARFVRRGGGLLIAVGDNLETDRANRELGELLPQELRGATSAAPPGSGEVAYSIGRVDGEHPALVGLLGEASGGGLRAARFQRVFRLSPTTLGERRTLLSYDDGSPALVEARRGQGRVLLFTSTIDRDWNDLPIRPGYLPLVQQLVRYLGRVSLEAPRHSVEVGSREPIAIVPAMRQLRLSGPGSERSYTHRELAEKTTLEIPVEQPGFYNLSASGQGGTLHPLERERFAANVDPKESDLRRSGPGGKSAAPGLAVRAKQRVELWHGVGVLLLLLLLGESFLVRRG
jgi:hypothetical protein